MHILDFRRLACIALVAPLVISACSSASDTPEEDVEHVLHELTPLSDAQVAGITLAATNDAIALSQIAIASSQNASVIAFSQKLTTDYAKVNADLGALLVALGLVPAPSVLSSTLTSLGASQTLALQTVVGPEFDRVYMDYQVYLHRTVLTLLDTQLIPAAQTAVFHDFLIGVRGTIAARLNLALGPAVPPPFYPYPPKLPPPYYPPGHPPYHP